jgi:serine/threonine protein kinase
MNATLATRTKSHTPPLFGPVPAGYEVLRLAAAGGCSEVWKVCETRTGTPFAWKRLRAEATGDPRAVARIHTEARVLAHCDGPGVVALHGDRTHETPPSMLLEWLEGSPLNTRMVRGEPLPARHAFWIARQIAQGLQTLAAGGYSHGDLRPANVFIEHRGAARLIELGSALPLDGVRGGELAASFGRSSPGHSRAVEYLAPERQTDSPFDPLAADVYGLGVILFEMLAGRPPFVGENPDDVLRLHRQARPPQLPPGVPSAGVELVERLLRKEPLRRPREPSHLVRRLLDLELEMIVREPDGVRG